MKPFFFLCFMFLLFSIPFYGQLDSESPFLYSMGGCGFTADSPMPQSAREMLELVNSRNYDKLKKWLDSPHPEIQAFGVKGMHFLCQLGIVIEEEEAEKIEDLLESSVSVNTCVGCLYSAEPMKNLLRFDRLADSFWYHKSKGVIR